MQRSAAKMKALAGKPTEQAALLDQWIDSHTRQVPMKNSVVQNLGPTGEGLSWWQGALANSVTPALMGPAAAQDLTTGHTRKLSEAHTGLGFSLSPMPVGLKTTVTRDALDLSNHAAAVLKAMLGAVAAKDRHAVAAAYAKRNGGKTLSAALGELILDANVRGPLMALVPPPVNEETLTLDAFLEQIAVGLVYSNQSAAEMNADTLDERRHSNPAALLSHFGYTAGPLILGRWGLQMRVFTPKAKGRWQTPIVAFRGTEGVQFDVQGKAAAAKAKADGGSMQAQAAARRGGIEGTVDTVIGDASPTQIGWLQVQPNQDLIEANLARVKGKAISTGHSLGGAIAQLVPALYPAEFDQVVTFQAANIDKAMVDKMRAYNGGKGQADPVTARHYRIDGDVVPTAGEKPLDGQIYYFDRVSRDKGSGKPFTNDAAMNASAGHVTPMLSTYLRGQRTLSPDLQEIVDNGLKDEATLSAKPGQKVQEVKTVFGGSYATAQDPRIVTEGNRKLATGKLHLVPGTDPFEEVVYANIAYNTLLSHIENLAADRSIKTFEQFKTRAEPLLSGTAPLPLDPDDVTLSKVLNMDHTETDYEARPIVGYPGTMPAFPAKYAPIKSYFDNGVPISPDVRVQVRSQLEIIWRAWRG
ncbi:hypothetical protein C8263_17750 [Deinococcus arcticus]|uniref:Fungal lipase-like domain-containing protein n=2 Tax=Deinococcus arcticus TaxID=2136176 RepID=A0A2T3W3K3_9DEIO|nr:hypothetical protein C8263_17750 [Deinococcus arcticus]